MKKTLSVLLIIALCAGLFGSCSNNTENKIIDVVSTAKEVRINGEISSTVEAQMGAFTGVQGDYIEFFFTESREINTVYIIEKTATVRQFNIFAEIDGSYILIHTGKVITGEEITFDTVSATALKIQIFATQKDKNEFIIQGISAYNIVEG